MHHDLDIYNIGDIYKLLSVDGFYHHLIYVQPPERAHSAIHRMDKHLLAQRLYKIIQRADLVAVYGVLRITRTKMTTALEPIALSFLWLSFR